MYSKEKEGLSSWKKLQKSWDEKDLMRIWNLTGSYREGYEPDVEKGMERFRQRIAGDKREQRVVRLGAVGIFWRIAAALLLLFGAGYLWNEINTKPAPALVTQSTIENQKKEIELADGTIVTLNERTELTFPVSFDGEKRLVQLKGEGFFDVASDASKPFMIETNLAGIRVVGTAFNVRSYEDEPFIEIFVREGEVKVTIKSVGKRHTLRAGEKLRYEVQSDFAEVKTDRQGNSLAWDTGMLSFKEDPLGELMTSMERLYDIQIKVQDPSLLSCPVTTSLEVGKLEEMLQVLESLCPLQFKENATGTYTLSGKCCN